MMGNANLVPWTMVTAPRIPNSKVNKCHSMVGTIWKRAAIIMAARSVTPIKYFWNCGNPSVCSTFYHLKLGWKILLENSSNRTSVPLKRVSGRDEASWMFSLFPEVIVVTNKFLPSLARNHLDLASEFGDLFGGNSAVYLLQSTAHRILLQKVVRLQMKIRREDKRFCPYIIIDESLLEILLGIFCGLYVYYCYTQVCVILIVRIQCIPVSAQIPLSRW